LLAHELASEVFLKTDQDERAGKTTDRAALTEWEEKMNNGRAWEPSQD
jgi:hypothetical protein